MILRKFQAGGNLSAKTEYVPMGIQWKDSQKLPASPKALDTKIIEEGKFDKYSNYKLEGLENDKQSLYAEIEGVKDRMKAGLSPKYTRESYDADATRLQKLITTGISDLTQKEKRYKEVVTATTSAKGELAINNGQAFVRDLQTGKYDVVSVDQLLTKKVTSKKGDLSSRYEPQTVGTALEIRATDPEFTGRHGGKGDILENMLHSLQSTKDLTTNLKAAFAGIGSSTDKDTDVTMVGGAPAGDMFNFLADKVGLPTEEAGGQRAITSETKKTNRGQLESAYNLLKSTLQSSGMDEVLKRNAIISYLSEYGGKPEAPDYQSYVSKKVDEQLNNAMLAHLTESFGNNIALKGKAGAAGGTGDEETIDEMQLNPITATLSGPLRISHITPTDDIHEAGDKRRARDLPVTVSTFAAGDLLEYEGFKNAAAYKLPKTAKYNTVMKDLSDDQDLEHNLFLGNVNNTPIAKMNDGNGLSQAVLAPGTNPVIYHNMPVLVSGGIAWDLLNSGMYEKITEAALRHKKNPAGEQSGAAFESAVHAIITDFAKTDKDIRDMGEINIRKVIRYDMIIPDDGEGFWGMASGSKEYASLVGEATKVKDKGTIAYYDGMTDNEDLAVKAPRGNDLYKVPVFSVLRTNKDLHTLAAKWYPSNKISSAENERLTRESIVNNL